MKREETVKLDDISHNMLKTRDFRRFSRSKECVVSNRKGDCIVPVLFLI
jgi:hypothetical protein